MSLRSVLVVIIIGVTFDVFAHNRNNERCGIQSSENQHPWLVAIEYEFSNEQRTRIDCTGALISVRHAVSKVKCADTIEKVAKSALLGLYSTSTNGICDKGGINCSIDGAIRAQIERFIAHPKYSKVRVNKFETGSYDIALVRFVNPVTYTDAIRPICLPGVDFTQSAATDLDLYVTGLDNENANKILNTGTKQLDYKKCEALRLDRVVPDDLICVKDVETVDPCLLTGGLLVNKKADTYELVGLLDIGSSCGLAKRFSHMFLYLDWLQSEIPEWTPCGRRKVQHIELIVYGESTKPGDWPWHVAIYKLSKIGMSYICGGTLITKKVVLTAAHCATVSGEPVTPSVLRVILGKHYLDGPNLESQEKEVQSVIVHEEFSPRNFLNNDIALLKLKSKAIYNDYVQPACIWSKEANDRLNNDRYVGTVIGWGLDQSEMLSSQLKRANMPRIPDEICIKKNPVFYSNVLGNNKKFCAGWANGTSTCNGDSGGGFFVDIPLTAKADSPYAISSWYVKGIVSLTVAARNKARCDPTQYAVYTDVANYTEWIQRHMDEESEH